VEYALRVIIGLGIIGALFVWSIMKTEGLREYITKELLTPDVIGAAVVDYYAKKILTATAGTDTVIFVFTSSEHWRKQLTKAQLEDHETTVDDLMRLCRGKDPEKVVADMPQVDAVVST